MQLLFSYGTLQFDKVQLESFGRLLKGYKDTLMDYRLEDIEIKDPKVLELSGKKFHPMAIVSVGDTVEGMVFEVTEEEIEQSDRYEVSDYKRQSIQLKSGVNAWVYVQA